MGAGGSLDRKQHPASSSVAMSIRTRLGRHAVRPISDLASCDFFCNHCNADDGISPELCSALVLLMMPTAVANSTMSSSSPDGYKVNLNRLVSDSHFHSSFSIFTASSASSHPPTLSASASSPTSPWFPLWPSLPWRLPLPQVLCCHAVISALSARLRYDYLPTLVLVFRDYGNSTNTHDSKVLVSAAAP